MKPKKPLDPAKCCLPSLISITLSSKALTYNGKKKPKLGDRYCTSISADVKGLLEGRPDSLDGKPST
jgi:hypothetical protein